MSPRATMLDDVRAGLCDAQKWLPAYLLYDSRGCELFERITELPEYYLSRAERAILEHNACDIARRLESDDGRPLSVVELGAGTAVKTELLLRELLRWQPCCTYVPIDVSGEALAETRTRLRQKLPSLCVRAVTGTHERALASLSSLHGRRLGLFIGSSVGNLRDTRAVQLLRKFHGALGTPSWLLLGTDLRKSPDVLLPAYDDAQGVTAAFNLNLLTRLRRECGAELSSAAFRHVAVWNERRSRVEMHLESLETQSVLIRALGIRLRFARGETIHTESSIKYDVQRVDAMLHAAGYATVTRYFDDQQRYAVHLARSA